jgi:hypothetical protein
MGERTRRWGLAIAIAALVAVGAGCTDTGTSPTPNPTLPPADWAPVTEFGPCHQVTISPGDTNGGYVAAFDWDDDVHAYGESVPLKGCFTTVGVAIPEGPPGVTFDPVQQQVPADEFGVVNFTVTVPDGSAGEILVELVHLNGHLFATPPGPVITPSGDGWKFTFPDLS